MKNLASFWTRLIAYAIDRLIFYLLPLYLIFSLSSSTSMESFLGKIIYFIGLIFVYITFAAIFNSYLISRFGGTIGKLLTGTRILSSDDKKISLGKAFFRNYIGYIVSGIVLWLGFFWIFVDKERRAWHDLITDTYVVVNDKVLVFVGLTFLAMLIGIYVLAGNLIIKNFKVNSQVYSDFAKMVSKKSVSFEVDTPDGWYKQEIAGSSTVMYKSVFYSPVKFNFSDISKVKYNDGFIQITQRPAVSLFSDPNLKSKDYKTAKEVWDAWVMEGNIKKQMYPNSLTFTDVYTYLGVPTRPFSDGAIEIALKQNLGRRPTHFHYWYVKNGILYEFVAVYPNDPSKQDDFEKSVLMMTSSFVVE